MEALGETTPRARAPITLLICVLAVGLTIVGFAAPEYTQGIWSSTRSMFYQPWRLVATIFPHLDIIHLVFNIYWTWKFGSLLETRLGAKKYIGLVLLLALFSSGAQQAFSSPGAGLSGVGYGFFGLLWVLSRRDDRYAGVVGQGTIAMFVMWFFGCIFTTILNIFPVANVAHGVGAFAGAAIGLAMTTRTPVRKRVIAGIVATGIFIVLAGTLGQRWINPKIHAWELAHKGYQASVRKDHTGAIAFLKESAVIDPTVGTTWVNLGSAYYEAGQLEDALRAYESAPAADRDTEDVREMRLCTTNVILACSVVQADLPLCSPS